MSITLFVCDSERERETVKKPWLQKHQYQLLGFVLNIINNWQNWPPAEGHLQALIDILIKK